MTDSVVRSQLQQILLESRGPNPVSVVTLLRNFLFKLFEIQAGSQNTEGKGTGELSPARNSLGEGGITIRDAVPGLPSRLQDFFGMTEYARNLRTGASASHLATFWPPNQRAVQVSQDLSGFWDRHYPSIRRELMRRYPKHQWPEDGRRGGGTNGHKSK